MKAKWYDGIGLLFIIIQAAWVLFAWVVGGFARFNGLVLFFGIIETVSVIFSIRWASILFNKNVKVCSSKTDNKEET